MEIAAVILGVLLEKARPDLTLRRWWSSRMPRLPLAVGSGIRRVPVPVALAGLDVRRLLLRPSTVLAAYVLYRIFGPALPVGDAYEGVNRSVGFELAFVGLIVLALAAAIGGRDRGAELVEATPASRRSPIWSWVVLLVGMAVVEYALLTVLRFGRPESPVYGTLLPDAWELAQGPIMLIGGGVLGLLAARLLPAWVASPLTVVVAIAWVGVFSSTFEVPMLAPVIEWIQYHEDERVVVEPGSFAWHNAYLLGLCGVGAVVALLTVPGRRHALVVAGSAIAVATAIAGALALP